MALAELATVARIAAVGLVSAGIGAGVYFVAEEGTSEGPEDGLRVAAPRVVATQAVPSPEPLSPPEQVDRPPTATRPTATAPAAPPPERVEACPDGWELFDNTVLHYTICYPSDWALSVHLQQVEPAALPEDDMDSQISLNGPGFFPLPEGADLRDLPADVEARVERAPAMTLWVRDPISELMGCTPANPETISGLAARWCENTYTRLGDSIVDFGPEGERRNVVVAIPLRSPQPPSSLVESLTIRNPNLGAQAILELAQEKVEAWQLMITAGSLRVLFEEQADALWRIIRSVEAY